MATLDSTSTYADALAAYMDNLSYDTDESVAKAKAFVEACRWLLFPGNSPKRTRGLDDGAELELDLSVVSEQLDRAVAYMNSGDTGSVIHPDFCGFRT